MTRINSTRSYAERGNDAYWTPPEATRSIFKLEKIHGTVFDPCCGDGAILKVAKELGHTVEGMDIIDYGWPRTTISNYLAGSPHGHTTIVTNPPYKLAQEFIQTTFNSGVKHHMWLLRLNFLESIRRNKFFKVHPPARIWVSSRRLPMMHRLGYEGPRTSSNHTFAWFVWEYGYYDAKIHWFDWKDFV